MPDDLEARVRHALLHGCANHNLGGRNWIALDDAAAVVERALRLVKVHVCVALHESEWNEDDIALELREIERLFLTAIRNLLEAPDA